MSETPIDYRDRLNLREQIDRIDRQRAETQKLFAGVAEANRRAAEALCRKPQIQPRDLDRPAHGGRRDTGRGIAHCRKFCTRSELVTDPARYPARSSSAGPPASSPHAWTCRRTPRGSGRAAGVNRRRPCCHGSSGWPTRWRPLSSSPSDGKASGPAGARPSRVPRCRLSSRECWRRGRAALGKRDDDVSSIKAELLLMKWMIGFVLAFQIAIAVKLFVH